MLAPLVGMEKLTTAIILLLSTVAFAHKNINYDPSCAPIVHGLVQQPIKVAGYTVSPQAVSQMKDLKLPARILTALLTEPIGAPIPANGTEGLTELLLKDEKTVYRLLINENVIVRVQANPPTNEQADYYYRLARIKNISDAMFVLKFSFEGVTGVLVKSNVVAKLKYKHDIEIADLIYAFADKKNHRLKKELDTRGRNEPTWTLYSRDSHQRFLKIIFSLQQNRIRVISAFDLYSWH